MSPPMGYKAPPCRPSQRDETHQAGFTIMEAVVTAGIVAVVLSATIGVLFRYTETDIQTQKTIRALHIAQSEVDEVLTHHAVENSLVSDTQGRARYYPLQPQPARQAPSLLVSQYFFHNFPTNINHGAIGQLDPATLTTLFSAPQYRNGTGLLTTQAQSTFTVRYQLLGIDQYVPPNAIDTIISNTGNAPSGYYNHQYLIPATLATTDTIDPTYAWNPLIGDSSPSVAVGGRWSNGVRRYTTTYRGYEEFLSRILIVRVYDRENPRRELGHAYGVLNGRVQL